MTMNKREALEEALHNAREDLADAQANVDLATVTIEALENALSELHASLRESVFASGGLAAWIKTNDSRGETYPMEPEAVVGFNLDEPVEASNELIEEDFPNVEPEPAHGYRQDAGYVQEQQQAFDGTGYLTEDTYPEEFAAPERIKPDMVDDLLPLDLTLQSGETGGPAPTPEQEEPEADAGIFETLRDLTPEPSLDLEPTPDEQRLLDALEAQKEPA